MRRVRYNLKHALACALVPFLGALGGCYEEMDTGVSDPAPAPSTEAPEKASKDELPPSIDRGGGNSTLGKAKGSAERTIGKVGERQRELEKELEGDD